MFGKGVKQEIDCKKTFLVQFAHYLNLVDRRLSVVKGGCFKVIYILVEAECGLERFNHEYFCCDLELALTIWLVV